MDTLLDAEVEPAFHGSLETARRRAGVEAANTGGVVLEAHAFEARGNSLTIIGAIPAEAFEARSAAVEGRPKIHSFALGRFHTTWRALLEPEDPIGFLVLQQPVTLIAGSHPDKDTALVATDLKRRFAALPSSFTLGPRCCADCNEVIPEQRLKAVPGTRTCTRCQNRREQHR